MLARRCHARRHRDRRRCEVAPGRDRGRRHADSSQSISATRTAVMRMLRGLRSPWTTQVCRPTSRAHAARHRATPSGGIAPRSILVPVSVCRRSVDDRQPGRCGHPAVNRCSRRSMSATRRQSASVSGGPPSTYVITTRPSRTAGRLSSGSAPARSDLHGRGVGGLGLPAEISVAPRTETTDREAPLDAHAPHVVGDPAGERLDAS